ncbi:MAG: zinc ribbon domain-containing protein [Proteobacteria bacterium]|nr:zinc ribbon domain-containing protein [Pseudomonadota bacterium]MCL2306721.1 zinc ribbon domain-containing protein [Pseudomonadota bacterium]
MALIQCHECGKDVSTEAVACPGCGAKPKQPDAAPTTKPSNHLSGKFVLITFIAIGVFIYYKANDYGPSDSSTSATTQPSPKQIKQGAIAALKIEKFDFVVDGFGNIMMLKNLKIQNNGARNIKDFEITCNHFSKSGTKIDSNKRTIFEVIEAGKAWSIKEFNMGFINQQAEKTRCEITDLVVM